MQFDNSEVRRQDRLMEEDEAVLLLRQGEYGFLALAGGDAQGGYGIPINYVFDGESIWFHCAPVGEKLRRAALCGLATFCVVGNTQVRPDKFSTAYESVMAFGDVAVVEDDETKLKALELLIGKYSPEYTEKGAEYARKSLSRTAILRMKIRRISAKAKY